MLQNKNKQLFQRILCKQTVLWDWTRWKQGCKEGCWDYRNSSLLSILWKTSRTFSTATADPPYNPQYLESPLSFHMCQSAMSANLSWAHKACPWGQRTNRQALTTLHTARDHSRARHWERPLIPPYREHKGGCPGTG